MSTLIDKLNTDNTGEVEKAISVYTDSFKRYRTLYFDNNIDIRLCPKNANTSIKHIFCQLHYNTDIGANTSLRKSLYEGQSHLGTIVDSEFLFRIGSYKIAVKRDPIERVLSSAKYILKTRLNIINPSIDMIEELLNTADDKTDFHFLSQTFWMGTPDLYDKVYGIHQTEDMIEYLQDNYIWLGKIGDTYKNISDSTIQVKDLAISTINKWKDFYKIDYDNGWY
tara:strand:+ start:57 stop:728 length:672 start_codon:yes stop_codon:yes gene_type:complete